MKCPHCGKQCAFGDAICRHCRWCFATGAVASISPPRAAGARTPPPIAQMSPWRLYLLRRERQGRPLSQHSWLGPCLLALVPGAGHLWYRRLLPAAEFAGAIVLLVIVGVAVAHQVWEGVLIGLAASLHAYSIVELFPPRLRGSFLNRLLAMFLIASLLFVCIYQPLLYAYGHDLPLHRGWRPRYEQ